MFLITIPFIFMPRKAVKNYIIRDENDAIELMLWQAMKKAYMVCITLDNDKVYVGFVSNMFEGSYKNDKSISLIPSISGYRLERDKTIHFTNYYEDIIEEVNKNPSDYNLDQDYISISILLDRVVSISYFDPAIHKYNKSSEIEERIYTS